MIQRVMAFFLGVGAFFKDGEGAWDQVVSNEPISPAHTAGQVSPHHANWRTIRTVGGYTWFIAADEEVVTWLV